MASKSRAVSLVLIWHFHQPNYKSPISGEYELPWTRLHITKDYLRMALASKKFPQVKMVFNYSPTLLEQIMEYSSGRATDTFLDVSLKRAEDLGEEEKLFLLEKFFHGNLRTMIKKIPRYFELFLRRGRDPSLEGRKRVFKQFSAQDFRDLQVLFNLSWVDSSLYEKCGLREIAEKEEGFSEDEKRLVLEAHKILAGETLSVLRALWEERTIDFWVSPYYHPILPLLCDSEIGKKSAPQVTSPWPQFRFPQDAETQVRKSVEFMERSFGKRPLGLWPSEGSVSDEVLQIIGKEGFKYLATDEQILARSLELPLKERDLLLRHLYKPYEVQTNSGPVRILFRDRVLSDLISFTYSSWHAETSAMDLVNRIRRAGMESGDGDAVVTLALDGENCWEYFDKNGADFISTLYEHLSAQEDVRARLPEELEEVHSPRKLSSIWPGSWIDHSFRIWIGNKEKNRAWELLTAARRRLEEVTQGENAETRRKALEHLYSAEGSDWFWWYGDDFYTAERAQFDRLFREHIIAAYREMGENVPPELYEEIALEEKVPVEIELPARLMSPVIDGIDSHFYEWRLGSKISSGEEWGPLSAKPIVKALHYGFDLENLYLRIDTNPKPKEDGRKNLLLAAEVIEPARYRVSLLPWAGGRGGKPAFERFTAKGWVPHGGEGTYAARDIIEIKVPFRDIGADLGMNVSVIVLLLDGNNVLESWPLRGRIAFRVPSPDYDDSMWSA